MAALFLLRPWISSCSATISTSSLSLSLLRLRISLKLIPSYLSMPSISLSLRFLDFSIPLTISERPSSFSLRVCKVGAGCLGAFSNASADVVLFLLGFGGCARFDVAHLVRVSPTALGNWRSGGVLSTDELPILVSLDRHEPLVLPRLKKWSTLGDGDLLPIGNSLQQTPCGRRIRWFLYVVCLIVALRCYGYVLQHNGERLGLGDDEGF